MANGKIIADTLEHSSAGSVDTQYVVNGSAKAWVNFTQVSTQAVRDSFNITSITDAGTGRTTPISYTNSMNNDDYVGSWYTNASNSEAYDTFDNVYTGGFGGKTTASCGIRSYGSSADVDSGICDLSIHGDLA